MKTPVKCYKDTDNSLKVESFYHIVQKNNTDTWSFPLHDHSDFLEISLIIEGSADIEYDHRRYRLRRGDLVVKNAGILHGETSHPKAPFEQYCLGISGVNVEGMPPNSLLPSYISPVISTGEAFDYLRAMTSYLYNLSCNPAMQTAEITKQAIENEISVINMLVVDKVESSERNHYSELTEKTLKYLDTKYGEITNLDDIAKQFFVSPYHLAHIFKNEIGCTINQYLLNRRLGEAQSRLVFTDDPIKAIAADCGYSNTQYFYSVFKKHIGKTPKELREYYKTIKASENRTEMDLGGA